MNHLPPLRIYITGVTGTGKTTIAKRLTERLFLNYLEINEIVLKKELFLGYDINRDSLIIDEDLLIPHLESIIDDTKRLCLVGGIIPLKTPFHLIIVLRCNVNNLRNRLQSRNYPEEKIESNVEAEIMNIIFYDAIELFPGQKVIEVNNDDHSIDETCDQIISIVRQHHPSVIVGSFD